MKNKYPFLTLVCLGFSSLSFGQDQLTREFAPIKSELQQWDPVRGEWLAESMLAISRKQPIPDRTFPEDFTPSEMIRMVPQTNRQNIQNTVNANRTAQNGTLNGDVWNNMSGFMQRSSCEMKSGRSYGDPHLSTYDGKTFSFQTVGEFIFTKSGSGNVEVQTRQKANGDDFSLNTAVAMNVSGDRVCIYADEKPDADFSNPLRIDGRSVRVGTDRTYYLSHGGTIRNDGKEYIVTWPTGEKVSVEVVKNSRFDFINITTHIYPCASDGYEGLMGNANGNPNDDINTRTNRYDFETANRFNTVFGGQTASMSNEAEKEYLNYLAKEFGHAWRVSRSNSLFDYGPGQSTEYFTDLSFPRFHRTVRDLSQTQRDNARRDCEARGIRGSELEGCIFDRAYVGIDPNPRPVFRDPTAGAVLSSVPTGRTVRNVNPPEEPPVDPRNPSGNNGSGNGGGRVIQQETKKPVETPASSGGERIVKPVVNSTPAPVSSGSSATKAPDGNKTGTDRPVVQPASMDPKPVVKPTTERKPDPKPATTVSPAPVPAPAPKPTIVRENTPVKAPAPVKPVESKPAVSTPSSTPVQIAPKTTTPRAVIRP